MLVLANHPRDGRLMCLPGLFERLAQLGLDRGHLGLRAGNLETVAG
jgi:hypothetical protein